MFETLDTVSKKTLETSSILISWGLIMILHIEADALASIRVDFNRITYVNLGRIATFAHVKEHPDKSSTQIFFHMKTCPLMSPLQYNAMREHPPCIPPQMNFLNFTRSAMSIFMPPTSMVTMFQSRMNEYAFELEIKQVLSSLEPLQGNLNSLME